MIFLLWMILISNRFFSRPTYASDFVFCSFPWKINNKKWNHFNLYLTIRTRNSRFAIDKDGNLPSLFLNFPRAFHFYLDTISIELLFWTRYAKILCAMNLIHYSLTLWSVLFHDNILLSLCSVLISFTYLQVNLFANWMRSIANLSCSSSVHDFVQVIQL